MKKIILALTLLSIISNSFAQKSALDLLNDKIHYTIGGEIPKYSDFGPANSLKRVVILDVSENDNKFVVKGEFTFTYKWDWQEYKTKDDIIKTFKYQAEVKQILDDFSVIKIIYQNPKDKEWYRLFPANKF